MLEAAPDAVHEQAHGLVGKRDKALHAKNRVRFDQRVQRRQQALAVHYRQFDNQRIEVRVMMLAVAVAVMRVMAVAPVMARALKRRLCGLPQAEQQAQVHAAGGAAQDFHGRGKRRAHPRLDARAGVGVGAVRLAQDHQVGGAKLILEQLAQGGIVVEIGIGLTLRANSGGIGRETPRGHGGGIDHREHRIHRAGVADLRPVKRLHQGLRQGQARGLDQNVVDLFAPFDQFAQHREKRLLHRAADTAVGEFEKRAAGRRRALLRRTLFLRALLRRALLHRTRPRAAEAAGAQDVAVDAEFAELVDDHSQAPPAAVSEQVAKQRGFTAAEKAGNDGGGNAVVFPAVRRHSAPCSFSFWDVSNK